MTIPPVEGSLAGTWTTTASYKVDGSPATVTYPAAAGLAAETVSYTYDNTGAALTAVGQDTYIAATTYHPWGDANQRILGSGTKRVRVTTTIDEATRRLTTNQTHTENQTTPGTWVERLTETYDYDPAGNIKSINETGAGTTISNQCLSYDPLRQLLEAWTTTATACQSAPSQAVVGGPDPYWASYRYDTVGNRTLQVSHAATGDTTRSYSYPAPGAPQPHTLQSVTASGAATGTNSYTYDPTGNTTGRDIAGQPGQTLTWDPEGHLATLTTSAGVTSYLYDAAGNRLIGNDANGATLYLGHTEIRRDPLGSATATRYCPGRPRHHPTIHQRQRPQRHPAQERPVRQPPRQPAHLAHHPRLRQRHHRPHRPHPFGRPRVRPHHRPLHQPRPSLRPRRPTKLARLHLRQQHPSHSQRPDWAAYCRLRRRPPKLPNRRRASQHCASNSHAGLQRFGKGLRHQRSVRRREPGLGPTAHRGRGRPDPVRQAVQADQKRARHVPAQRPPALPE